ncbi:MAG: cupin domain-containing protein [Actinobacteria bacterium]|nr:cupin domain-containing protein [Actinomycetota bacterium]
MEIKRYAEAASFSFGNLVVRDVTPESFERFTLAEIEVPIGADNPPYAAAGKDKVYVGISGEIEFVIDGAPVRVTRGDVLVVRAGEQYSYHNGGYEMGRLFLLQVAV